MPDASIPLCVDLDGTLTRTDLLVESFLVLVKKIPCMRFTASSGYCEARLI